MKDASPTRPRPLALPAAVAAVLALAVAGVYRHAGGFAFVFDDGGFILGNPRVTGGLSVESARWALTATYTANWHPLTWLSHLLDVSLFGLRPGPPHLVNVVIHAVNTVLVLLVLRRLTGTLWPGAFAAALFGVHPLHVESVAWVSERKDVLSALLWLLATAAYVRYAARRSVARYLLVCLLFALGLAAKAMVVTLPAVLLLLDFWPLGRLGPAARGGGRWRAPLLEKVPLLAISAAGSLLAIFAQRDSGALASGEVYRLAWRAANAAISYAVYLGKTLWPAGLAAYYSFRLEAPPASETAAAALLLLCLSAAALALARRAPWLAAGWGWYLVTLLPVIGLIQVGGQARADRYLYLPMIGLAIVAAWGAPALAARLHRAPTALAAPAAVALLALAAAGSLQAGYWRSNETLFRHALAVTRDNWLAHSFLGAEARKRGDAQAAVAHYREAVRGNTASADMRYNLGLALAEAGLTAEAISELRMALHLNPAKAEATLLLARSLALAGDVPAALATFRAAARLMPDRADVWNDLGNAAFRFGALPEAEAAFSQAVRLQPGSPLYRWNLQQAQAPRAR
ncbi:MAG TPA: tetratricopeptide repeat protein [bacterium]